MHMTREQFEAMEERDLAPFALRSAESRGRQRPEPQDPHRPVYARDRDRIVYSGAFRRLEYKTQVIHSAQGDNYRTRLTHSLEVSQIARSIARVLGLNADLVEAVALAHDLGHPPYGHTGEDVLNDLMKEHGGFEHNAQALRVVDVLEAPYPGLPGLNLTFETRESMLKHGRRGVGDVELDLVEAPHPWLEAQIVDLADSLAYHSHDLDDGLRFGVFGEGDLEGLALWERARGEAARRYPGASAAELLRPTIHQTLQLPLFDLLDVSGNHLRGAGVGTALEARHAPRRLISFSDDMGRMQAELRRFLFQRFYRAERVVKEREEARHRLEELFRFLLEHPRSMASWALHRFETCTRHGERVRVVCDYVAGMTDRFADSEYRRLVEAAT